MVDKRILLCSGNTPSVQYTVMHAWYIKNIFKLMACKSFKLLIALIILSQILKMENS